MKKFPKIKYPNDEATNGLLDDEIVVTEKLDGANFRFTWNEHGEMVFGSRNVTFTENGKPLPIEGINHDFRHAVKFVKTSVPYDLPFLKENYTFYGEAMHLHSLEYEDIEYSAEGKGMPRPTDGQNVVIFDVRRNGEWLDWNDVEAVTEAAGLPLTRVIARGDPEFLQEHDALEVPDESMFGGTPEGIVARRADGTIRAKKVTDGFRETNATAFNDPSKAESDAAEFVAMFVTRPRIEDQAHKLVDEGDYDQICMEMMQDLPAELLRDVMEEEGWNLLTDEYGFECQFDDDFKSEARSRTSRSCARTLRTMCNAF